MDIMDIIEFRKFLKEQNYIHFEANHSREQKTEFVIKTNIKNLVEIVVFERADALSSLNMTKMYVCHTDSYYNMISETVKAAFEANQFYSISIWQGDKEFILPEGRNI